MTLRVVRHWIARLGFVGGMALVLAGCPEDAADITEFASDPSWNFPVAGAYVEPMGSFNLDGYVLADFDPTRDPDAFARGNANFTDYPVWVDTIGWIMGAGEGTPVGIADVDTRKPLLTMSAASYVVDYADITNGVYTYEGDWDFYGYVCCLTPGAEYVVGLERNALQVNGELDAEAVLLNQPITDPDSLFWLGGAPGGDHTRAADLWNYTAPYFAEQNANPYIFGYVSANVDGYVVLDCVVSHADAGGTAVWMPTLDPDQNLSIVAPNQVVPFDFPNYNYLTFWERNPDGTPNYSRPLARYQMGVDLDANGDPINNALAPFPDGPFTDAELIAAPGGAGRPDSLDVTYSNLEGLVGGAVYEPWLLNPITGSQVPARGTYNRIKIIPEFDPITGAVISTRDSIVETTSDVGSFVGGNEEYGYRHQLVISDGAMPGGASDSVGLHTHLVLAITSSPGGTSLPVARPFFFEYTDQNGTAGNYFDDTFNSSGVTTFGNFDPTDPTLSRPYSGEGQGTGGFREDELVVEMVRLSRPPVGYQLVGWLIDKDGAAYRLPDITGPPPERLSLVNADVEDVPELTTRNGILEANFRALEGTLGVAWSDMRIFLLTLEPKLGNTGIGPIFVQVGAVPPPIIEGGD